MLFNPWLMAGSPASQATINMSDRVSLLSHTAHDYSWLVCDKELSGNSILRPVVGGAY